MVITAETPIHDIVAQFPNATPVLESFGIGDCCGGRTTLGETCTSQHLNLASVLEALKPHTQ